MQERQRRETRERPHLATRQSGPHALDDVGRETRDVAEGLGDAGLDETSGRRIHGFETHPHERCLDRRELFFDFFEWSVAREGVDLRGGFLSCLSKKIFCELSRCFAIARRAEAPRERSEPFP